MLGKTEGRRRRGRQRKRWLDGIINSMDMSLSKLGDSEKHGMLQSMGLQRVGHGLGTQQQHGSSVVKNLPANAGGSGDSGSIPGSGRFPGRGNDNSLQYYSLENPKDRGAWQSMGSQRVGYDRIHLHSAHMLSRTTQWEKHRVWRPKI